MHSTRKRESIPGGEEEMISSVKEVRSGQKKDISQLLSGSHLLPFV
ncbi:MULTISPECIES: hypothetical protein [Porphyromonas]|nr:MULTISPECIES: hypothetical protein [Porphyromonas]